MVGPRPAAFEPLCADEFAYEDPLTPEPLHGVARARRARAAAVEGVPGRPRQQHRRAPERRPLRVRAVQAARHALGRLGGITPTGRFIVVHAVVYAELQDDQLLRARAFFDVHGAADRARRAAAARHDGREGAAPAARLRAAGVSVALVTGASRGLGAAIAERLGATASPSP